MRKSQGFFLAICLLSTLWSLGCQTSGSKKAEAPAPTSAEAQDPGLIGKARQITFVGSKAGEGYFSPDGRLMVFQSERMADNPFYQIYLMDMDSGETKRISSGEGKTTCAWIHPDKTKVIYASTHLDPQWKVKAKEEMEARQKKQRAKYSWSYDEAYDLFSVDMNGKGSKRLTKELGYDAEASYSPDGKWVAFASNRRAYSDKLSDEEKKLFAENPAHLVDIYLMKADGTNVQRLTTALGYDGGPFFSPDGQRIIWRHFTTEGHTAEVYTMKLDGSDHKKLTNLGAMSWAPFYHPSGDYVIFTTNLHGHDNFELYMVDAEGRQKPVRVSYLPNFDGLPVFTPDGRHLTWTRRDQKGESQIYLAEWNDQKARALLGLGPSKTAPMSTQAAISADDAKAWVEYLASESMKGRQPGTPEEVIYTDAIAQAFKTMGLKPGLKEGMVQKFPFVSGVRLGQQNQMQFKLKGQERSVQTDKDWWPLSFSKNGDFPQAPVVFAGYGIVAPASDKQPVYDSYAGLDVKGKWVLAFRDIPENVSSERRFHLNLYSRPQHKAMVARNAGAVGLILISGDGAEEKRLRFEGGSSEAGIPVIAITHLLAEQMVMGSKRSLKAWRSELDKGLVEGEELAGVEAKASVELVHEKAEGRNVVAKLTVPGAKSSIMIGGHGDHLGHGDFGNSLAKADERGQVHYGADDNASGVAGVMELAQYFSEAAKTGKLKLRHNLLFAVWSGEEMGVLGSNYYLKNMGNEPIQAYLNMDMVGRLREQLFVQGLGSAHEWVSLVEPLAAKSKLAVSVQNDPYLPTDSMAFYMKNIPAISFFTGAHGEYHSPRDRVETINFPGLVQTVEMVRDMTKTLATAPRTMVTYRKVQETQRAEGRGFRLYLGTIPDYAAEGVAGLRLSGTIKESPAEKAGLMEGDVIVELANNKIQNIHDYVYCLQSMKANERTKVKVLRQGRVVELEITPTLKGS